MFNASRVQRVFFFNLAILNLVAIGLTGFDKVHWFAYVVPGGLLFAAATGLCLGLMTAKVMLNVFGVADKPGRSVASS